MENVMVQEKNITKIIVLYMMVTISMGKSMVMVNIIWKMEIIMMENG